MCTMNKVAKGEKVVADYDRYKLDTSPEQLEQLLWYDKQRSLSPKVLLN